MKLFTEEQINKIYNEKVKKSPDYFNKKLGVKCPSQKWNYSWKGKDPPRCFCIRDFREWLEKYDIKKCKSLGYTSESDPEIEFIEAEKKFYYPYFLGEDTNEKNDLHTFVAKEKHDFFIFNQTLEHVYNPFLVIQNISQNILKGGYVFTSVPTVNIPHQTPFNFYNHYPMGLAMLFSSLCSPTPYISGQP